MRPAILTAGASTVVLRFLREVAGGQEAPFELHTAANSAEALDGFRGTHFALILVGSNGDSPSLVPALKAANPGVPVLLLADGERGPGIPAASPVEQEMTQTVLNVIGDAVLGLDASGRLTYANNVAQRLLGREASLLYGIEFTRACPIHDSHTEIGLNPMTHVAEADPVAQATRGSVLIRADGTEMPIEYSISPLYDQLGSLAGAVFVFRDLTESLAMTERMSYLAHHDFLTDLPNRVLLNDRLSQCISAAERHNRRLAILFLDLDGFKLINDSLGHSIGDELLKEVAQRLMLCVRRSDTVSRQGGDEFVVLLAEVSGAQDAAVIAEKMRVALGAPYFISSHQLHLRCSIGISVYPDGGPDADTLIRSADMAMYHAKETGRNRVQFFENEMSVRVVRRQSMIQAMSEALIRKEFVLHYQPTYNLHTSEIKSVEALIRWQRPLHGLVTPGHFISIAEDSGLIESIGQWVLREACAQARAWISASLPVQRVSVNVSAVEFNRKSFLESVRSALKDTGLEPWRLEIELTETAVMRDVMATSHVLEELSADGVRFAMDDFGTGYSSLNHLMLFPIDTLKIDKSFVQDVRTNANAATIVTAIVQLGQSLELEVIAEGIETAEQLRFLALRGCDAGQGFYFGPPVSAGDVPKHFAARPSGQQAAYPFAAGP